MNSYERDIVVYSLTTGAVLAACTASVVWGVRGLLALISQRAKRTA